MANVVAKYRNKGGGATTITDESLPGAPSFAITCDCSWSINHPYKDFARKWAQEHANSCTAMPL